MLILESTFLPTYRTDAPISSLNALWCGSPDGVTTLPQLGHVFLVCPLAEAMIACCGTTLVSDRYLWVMRASAGDCHELENLKPDKTGAQLLILLLSPDFIADMGDFLNIPVELGDLLHGIPLIKGDVVSHLLQMLADTLHNREEAEALFLEVVGQLLHVLRLCHQALVSLSNHKHTTQNDLIPRLLQARQFIEAQYLEPIKTHHIADYVALSEYHFSRLFKAAFDVTVHQYVLRLRLDQARHLLESPSMSITDIALSIGYDSLSAFISAFRKYFDMTPYTYRSIVRDLQN
jgi:AraC-like DNA-binding protein